jgi:hypothetical protein
MLSEEEEKILKQDRENLLAITQDSNISTSKKLSATNQFKLKWLKLAKPGEDDKLINPDGICPKTFGVFPIVKWGGFGACGFNLWDHNGAKYWIELESLNNKIINVAEGPNATSIGEKVGNDFYNFKVEHNPNYLFELFPQGYKTSSDGPVITKPAKGGKKRKSKKSKKSKKSRKYRKSKKSSKSRKSKKSLMI